MDSFLLFSSFFFVTYIEIIRDLLKKNKIQKTKRKFIVKILPRKNSSFKFQEKIVKKKKILEEKRETLEIKKNFLNHWLKNQTFPNQKKTQRKEFLLEKKNSERFFLFENKILLKEKFALGNQFSNFNEKKLQLLPLNIENKMLTEFEADLYLRGENTVIQNIKKCLNSIISFEKKKILRGKISEKKKKNGGQTIE
jgi:hypothetical protein